MVEGCVQDLKRFKNILEQTIQIMRHEKGKNKAGTDF
jgi:hypothetical protein